MFFEATEVDIEFVKRGKQLTWRLFLSQLHKRIHVLLRHSDKTTTDDTYFDLFILDDKTQFSAVMWN